MGYHTSSIIYLNVTPGHIHDYYEVPVIFNRHSFFRWQVLTLFVEALRYKTEGPEFISRCYKLNFSLT